MTLFSYKGTDVKGKVVEDTINASTKEDAISALKTTGIKILALKSIDTSIGQIMKGHISLQDKAVFCRFMSTMLRSGLSIPEALEIMRAETKNQKMRKILADLAFQTQKGKNLTSVLAQYKEDFDSVFLTMIKVGEESGTLEKSFEYLTKQLTASYDLGQKIKGSLMYPAVIVVAMMGNGLVMTIFVLPRIAEVFLKFSFPLPLPTRIVLGIGNFVGHNIALTLGGIATAVVVLGLMFYINKTRTLLFNLLQKLPVVSKVVKQIDIARFARTLSTLLRSGVSITSALDVTADALTSANLKKEAKKFSQGIEKGETLSQVLTKDVNLFPPIMVQTIKAGEKTGTLDQILEEMAIFYENEVDYSLKRATALLEPVLMLIIGVVVGIMVIVMIAPIYGIIGGLQQQVGGGGSR
jgi:type II secretory pathway component PulF